MQKKSFPQRIAKDKNSLSPKEWEQIWLNKVSKELERNKVSIKESQFHCSILLQYLAEHPGNPRAIPIEKLKKFIAKQKKDIRQPLILFYTNVARSEAHMEALNSINPPKPNKPSQNKRKILQESSPPVAFNKKALDTNRLLDELAKELKIKKYGLHTIKNYRSLCWAYLSWLKRLPSADDADKIKQYQLYLKQDKSYAPRTINVATAALQFFYTEVLKIDLAFDPLPKIKTKRRA
jgi:hypothetical protein